MDKLACFVCCGLGTGRSSYIKQDVNSVAQSKIVAGAASKKGIKACTDILNFVDASTSEGFL